MDELITTRKLSRVYKMEGYQVDALNKVSLTIRKGDFIALQGPSGSGKTTLLNLFGCLDSPSSGTLKINKQDVSTMDEKQLRDIRGKNIGYIFQNFNLLPILNAVENVELPMEHTIKNKFERREKALGLLKLVGLEERAEHRVNLLSGGEKQRVAIARAMANSPPIILADEPTGNLDSKTGKSIIELLKDMNKKFKTTIIMVTHDNTMAEMTQKILFLRDGKIEKEQVLFEN